MTTDITELAQSMKAAATNVKETAHIARYSKATIARQTFKELMTLENILALVEALEKAQRYANLTEAERQAYLGLISKRDERIAELEQKHCGGALVERELAHSQVINKLMSEIDNRDSRIAELESRSVKLPEPFKLAKSSSGLTYHYADEVNESLSAAGIKWEAE